MGNANKKLTTPNYFPSDVLKWIKKNANPRMSFILMQVCKYFQHKTFPFYVVKSVIAYNEHIIALDVGKTKYDCRTTKDLPNNIWLTGTFRNSREPFIFSSILINFAICDIHRMELVYAKITYNDLKYLTARGKVESVRLWDTDIMVKEWTLVNEWLSVPLEDILCCLPKAKDICIYGKVPNYHHTKKLITCPELSYLHLSNIKENFNIKAFSCFMIENQRIKYKLNINSYAPKKYKKKVQKCDDKIIKVWNVQYNRPSIFWF